MEPPGDSGGTGSCSQCLFFNYLGFFAIEELGFLTKSHKIKRFKMWVNRNRIINLVVYFIELTNDKVTMDTDLGTFISGSSLTFVREAWVII